MITGAEEKPKLFNNSLQRGLQILEAFENGHQTLGLAELVQMTGIEKSAVQRLTSTLVATGMLLKDAKTRRYMPAPGLVRLGARYLRGNALIERATPLIKACSEQLNLTVNLGVLDGQQMTIVVRSTGTQTIMPNVGLGSSFPWHISAMGQAVVAFLPPKAANDLIDRVRFARYASKSIMTREALIERLEEVRRVGTAVSSDEVFDGDCSIGAPVFDATNQVIGAVSIHGIKGQNIPAELNVPVQMASGLAKSISFRNPWSEGA